MYRRPPTASPSTCAPRTSPPKTVTSYLESVRAFAEWLERPAAWPTTCSAISRDHVRGFLLGASRARTEGIDGASPLRLAPASSSGSSSNDERDGPSTRWLGVSAPHGAQEAGRRSSPTTSSRRLRRHGRGVTRRSSTAATPRSSARSSRRVPEPRRSPTSSVDDVDLSRGRVWFHTTKGDKPREVGLGSKTARSIDRYLRERRHHPEAAAPSGSGSVGAGGSPTVGIAQMLEARRKLAGIDQARPPAYAPPLLRPPASRGRGRGGRPDAAPRLVRSLDARSPESVVLPLHHGPLAGRW